MAIFDSIEFYVISAVAAAAVVAMCVKPSGRGEARQYLLAGLLGDDDTDVKPSISMEVDDDCHVILTRYGLSGLVHASGALSLVVTVADFDISIEERLTPGSPLADVDEPSSASVVLDFLGPERYHVRYLSESVGGIAVTPLHVRPGIKIDRSVI